MVKILIINLIFLSNSTFAWALAPTAGEWKTADNKGSAIPTAIFYTDLSVRKKPKFLKLPSQKDSAATFVKILSHKTAELSVKFNSYHKPKTEPILGHFREMKRLLHTDLFVDAAHDIWDIYTLDAEGISKIASAPKPTNLTYQSLNTWLSQALNFGGIVVAINTPYVLVATADKQLKIGYQAVSIDHSQSTFALKSEKMRGGSILELDNTQGQFSVFKIIVGPTSIPIGTKIQTP